PPLVRAPTGQWGQDRQPRLCELADPVGRNQAGALTMASPIHALVAVDSGVDSQAIQSMLPDGGSIEVVGIINGLEESWRTLQETAPDLVVIACEGYSDRTLYFIESAVKQQTERVVIGLTGG